MIVISMFLFEYLFNIKDFIFRIISGSALDCLERSDFLLETLTRQTTTRPDSQETRVTMSTGATGTFALSGIIARKLRQISFPVSIWKSRRQKREDWKENWRTRGRSVDHVIEKPLRMRSARNSVI